MQIFFHKGNTGIIELLPFYLWGFLVAEEPPPQNIRAYYQGNIAIIIFYFWGLTPKPSKKLGFRVLGFGFRFLGFGFRARVQGLGSRV